MFISLGCMIGLFTAMVLYATKPVWIALLIAGILLLSPTFFFREYRLYWFGVYLFMLQFEINKNLNDGLAVVEALGIDYTIWDFTFKVHASDLIFAVLMVFWVNDLIAKRKPLYWPKESWMVLGFLALSVLSLTGAPSIYLGLVELSRQLKFFLVFLWAANNVNSKRTLKLVAIMAVVILSVQGAVTAVRFQTGWLEPLTFSENYQEEERTTSYLSVDRGSGETIRAFGTLTAPGSTLRLCLMVIPFALMLSVRNPMFGMRSMFLVLAALGMGALLLTFTRAYFLTIAVQFGAAFVMAIRNRYLSRMEILASLFLAFSAVVAVTPKLIEHLEYRPDSYTVRLNQYSASLRMIVDNPMLGVGLNNGTSEKGRYVNVSFNKFDPDTQFYLEPTHNLYLSLTSEIGIPGAILYFGFFAVIAWRTYRTAVSATDPEIRFFAAALVVVAAGAATSWMFDPFHEEGPVSLLWLYSGIAVALSRLDGLGEAMRLSVGGAPGGTPAR